MILTADDVGDGHLDVIDDIHKVENVAAVGSFDDKIGIGFVFLFGRRVVAPRTLFLEVGGDLAADEVGHRDPSVRNTKANRPLVLVDPSRSLQGSEITIIDRVALTLEIRAVPPPDARTFVPIETEPSHPLENDPHGLIRAAVGIGILDPNEEFTAVVTSVKPVVKSGP